MRFRTDERATVAQKSGFRFLRVFAGKSAARRGRVSTAGQRKKIRNFSGRSDGLKNLRIFFVWKDCPEIVSFQTEKIVSNGEAETIGFKAVSFSSREGREHTGRKRKGKISRACCRTLFSQAELRFESARISKRIFLPGKEGRRFRPFPP